MSKNFFKSNSITKKLLMPMIVALIVQAIFFASAILWSGALDELDDNVFNILNERVTYRNKYLESEMKNRWSDLEDSTNLINIKIENILKNRGLTTNYIKNDKNLSIDLLEEISHDLVVILKHNDVDASFLILDNNFSEKSNYQNDIIEKSGIYIRSFDNKDDLKNPSNVVLERGPISILNRLDINKSKNWNENFNFNLNDNSENINFFIKPLNAAKKYNALPSNSLGYWNNPFSLNKDEEKEITYSLPLKDSDGNVYGILGVAINVDVINDMLPYKELDSKNRGAYFIGLNNDKNKFNTMLLNKDNSKNNFENFESISVSNSVLYNNFYELKLGDQQANQGMLGCAKSLQLYDDNSPFSNEKWALIGIVKKDSLLQSIKFIKKSLILSICIATVIGIFTVLLGGSTVIRPIMNLAKKVRGSDPKQPVLLEKIKIMEIDDLSSAIETLSAKVADSASKLSQIISLLNMPIGAFEYKKDDDIVFCTEAFFSVLGVEAIKRDCTYVDKAFFKEIIAELTRNSRIFCDGIYDIEKGNGESIWVKLRTFDDGARILGVISDVTQDILEKRKIEYERDYDSLTNILNRRAFYNIVTKKLEEDNIGIGAFVMWDLDNLKYVNDIYGHDYGDKYIKKAASILKKFTRYNGIVARMSGDEFYVFIYGYDSKEEIREIIKNVHKTMKSSNIVLPNKSELKIRASAGIAWYPYDSISYEELAKYSDFAMYKIKNTVKGYLNEFNMEDYKKDSFLLNSKEELNKLIDNELVRYAFQPIVDAHTGKIYGYEALMRSQLEELKNPIDIIRLATSQFKLYQIEKLTWFKTLEVFACNNEKFEDAKLFINSIPNYVLSDEDLYDLEYLYGSYTNKIVFELLENERSNRNLIFKKRNIATKWNSNIAIDDFGAGYNNEALLLDITPDIVKIDMEIVRGIDKDLNRQQILKNIISYSKDREIKIVAEGVETKEELEILIEFGVDYLQGYYLSKPDFDPPKISEDIVQEIIALNSKVNEKDIIEM
ncbi:EAL domain-containing protein [Clostridium sp. CTA-5]